VSYRVFISHASRDRWVAGQLAKELSAVGVDCYLDEHLIETGDDVDQVLRDALNEASELVVLLTPTALERPYVWIESALPGTGESASRASCMGLRPARSRPAMASPDFSRAHDCGTSMSLTSTLVSYSEDLTMTDADHPSQVFLSYSREDLSFVRTVADELRRQGVGTWFDEMRLLAGTHWMETVAHALAASEVAVVFVGDGLHWPWALFEVGVAVGGTRRVLPVWLTEESMSHAPAVLRAHAGIDAHALKPDEVAERIADAVRGAQPAPPRG